MAMLACHTGMAAGIDCGAARTAADHVICSAPALRAADAQLARDYAAVRAGVGSKALAAALAEGQRAWLASRDHFCADAACLSARIAARDAVLAALAARASAIANGLLTDLDAAWLDGAWLVETTTPPALAVGADLETPGTRLVGRPGALCTGGDEESCGDFALEPNTLDGMAHALPAALALPADTPAYQVLKGGKAAYAILLAPDGRLMAFTPACGPGGTACGEARQYWRPVSAASRLRRADARRP